MDLNIFKVKTINLLLIFFITVELMLLIIASMTLASVATVSTAPYLAAISAAVLIVFCIVLCYIIYRSAADVIFKNVFYALVVALVGFAVSNTIIDLISANYHLDILVPAGLCVMALSYLPLILTLITIYLRQRTEMPQMIKLLVFFPVLSFVIVVTVFVVTSPALGRDNDFSIAIFTSAVIADAIAIALSSLLALINRPTRLRYLFSIVFGVFCLSFIADILSLMSYLGVGDFLVYSGYVYDIMYAFGGLTALVFVFGDARVTTVEEVHKKLLDTSLLVDDLIMQSPDAMCMCDTGGNIMKANEAFHRDFGVAPGHPANIFKGDFGVPGLKDRLRPPGGGEVVNAGTIGLPVRDAGGQKYLSLRLYPTSTTDGTVSHYFLIGEDVTAEKLSYGELEARVLERTNELFRLNIKLQEEIDEHMRAETKLIEIKSQAELYLDLMGHDISNLNQIAMGYLELASTTLVLSPEERLLLETPMEALKSSTRLIRNVRKLQRARSTDPCCDVIDLGVLLCKVSDEYSHMSDGKVNISCPPVANCMVKANDLLVEVFSNLVHNAIKHSGGSPEITIKLKGIMEGGRAYYRVAVEDNGPGITDVQKARLFERQPPGQPSTSRKGIGLYLVKVLVESYAGSVWVEDRVPGDMGKGSRFVVVLPAA